MTPLDLGFVSSPACTNGKLDQNESDLDCGGVCGATCTYGQHCRGNMDCAAGTCMNGVCAPTGSSCLDHFKDGSETDADCGGGTCPKCADGKHCAAGSDYASGMCGAGVCAAGKPRFDFAAARFFGVGRGPSSIAAADYDRDGKLDLAVAAHQSRDVSVLLGFGDGTLHDAIRVPLTGDPQSIEAADLDGDGQPDLITANRDTNTLTVLHNTGHGSFAVLAEIPADMAPADAIAADLNRDGKLDLIASAQQSGSVQVFLGAGDGKTWNKLDPGKFWSSAGPLAAGDLNGDGFFDVAAIGNYQVNLLLGDGMGGLSMPVSLALSPYPWFVIAADLRKSGRLDLVSSTYEGYLLVSLAKKDIGMGGSLFDAPTKLDVGGAPGVVRAADFDGDGTLDLTSVNLVTNVVHVFAGRGDGSFEPAQNFFLGGSLQTVAVGDFIGDG